MDKKRKNLIYFFLISQMVYCLIVTVLYINTKKENNIKKVILFDLRDKEEYRRSHIEGAVDVTPEDLIKDISTYNIKKEQAILLYCGKDCGISSDVQNELEKKGYSKVYTIEWESLTQKNSSNDINVEYASISMKDFIEIINELDEKNYLIIDVRNSEEYKKFHIRNAVNIPIENIKEEMLGYCNKDKSIYVYCQSGKNSKKAAKIISELGYKNVFDIGGIEEYNQIKKDNKLLFRQKE